MAIIALFTHNKNRTAYIQSTTRHTMPNTAKISIAGLIYGLIAYMLFSTHDAIVKSLSDYSIFQILFFAMLFSYVPFSVARIFDRRPQTLLPADPKLVGLHSVLTVANFLAVFIAFTTAPLVEIYVLLFSLFRWVIFLRCLLCSAQRVARSCRVSYENQKIRPQ